MSRSIDLVGKQFGRLTVLHEAGRDKHSNALWQCECSCGVIKTYIASKLRSGTTRSCGCLHNEELRQRKITHNMTNTAEYEAWRGMIKRCTNPNCKSFKDYGARGIKICEEWLSSFVAFYNSVGPKPTPAHEIDRINNNGNYEPGNCKWSISKEQCNNMRRNHKIVFNGESMNIGQWATKLGINVRTLRNRLIRNNWPIEKAFTEPIHQSHIPRSSPASDP